MLFNTQTSKCTSLKDDHLDTIKEDSITNSYSVENGVTPSQMLNDTHEAKITPQIM